MPPTMHPATSASITTVQLDKCIQPAYFTLGEILLGVKIQPMKKFCNAMNCGSVKILPTKSTRHMVCTTILQGTLVTLYVCVRCATTYLWLHPLSLINKLSSPIPSSCYTLDKLSGNPRSNTKCKHTIVEQRQNLIPYHSKLGTSAYCPQTTMIHKPVAVLGHYYWRGGG